MVKVDRDKVQAVPDKVLAVKVASDLTLRLKIRTATASSQRMKCQPKLGSE